MSPLEAPPMVGSLIPMMDELVRLAEGINETEQLDPSEQLEVFRWKPARTPSKVPALWHWLTGGLPPEQKDLNRIRDHVAISAYVATTHSDSQDDDLALLERLADAYRDVIDPALYAPRPRGEGPLNGTARWASRQGMRLVSTEINGVMYVAFEFPLEIDLDRPLNH